MSSNTMMRNHVNLFNRTIMDPNILMLRVRIKIKCYAILLAIIIMQNFDMMLL